MRLLDARALVNNGQAKLVEYIDERSLPKYAILSHTWGAVGEEVVFEDIKPGVKVPEVVCLGGSGVFNDKHLHLYGCGARSRPCEGGLV